MNPREVWLIAIVLAGVSFVGYGAVKLFGAERGVLLGALAGGLVSSTAVTLTNARHAAANEGAPRLLAAGVAAAGAVSFLRVIAIVAVLQPVLLRLVVPGLALAAVVAGLYAVAAVHSRGGGTGGKAGPADFANPFSFWPVVGFALFLGLVIVASRMIGDTFGTGGALLGAAGVGLADVDSVTVAMSRLVPVPLGEVGAASAILAAVASNMLSKLVIAGVIGRGRFAGEVAVMTVGCWLAGGLGFWGALVFSAG